LLGWVASSIIGTRLLLKVGYRTLSLIGTSIFVCGSFLMMFINPEISQNLIMVFVTLMGIGMGLSIPSFVIAVQTSVERHQLGTATSTLQFARSMGGTLGVSVMGAALSLRLASNLKISGLDPKLVDALLDPAASSGVAINEGARLALANSIHLLFIIAFSTALLAWFAAFNAPKKDLNDHVRNTTPAMPME
jgi:MFS family permease